MQPGRVPRRDLRADGPDALAEAMGNQLFLAVFDTQEQLDAFYRDAVESII